MKINAVRLFLWWAIGVSATIVLFVSFGQNPKMKKAFPLFSIAHESFFDFDGEMRRNLARKIKPGINGDQLITILGEPSRKDHRNSQFIIAWKNTALSSLDEVTAEIDEASGKVIRFRYDEGNGYWDIRGIAQPGAAPDANSRRR